VITRIKFLEQTRPIVTSYQSENPILQSALETESMNTPERSKSELLVSSQLLALEAESIHIIREVVAEFEKPGLLFSGGKDSIVMLHLAVKALRPAKLPFPIVHIDTGHNFPEAIEYRDRTAENLGIDLIVGSVQEALDSGGVQASTLPGASRNRLQTPVLLDTIRDQKFDAVFGGARRDEERARAKERVYSFRDEFGQWDPKNQRPELWNLYNGFTNTGQHIRVFPLSNWTELDIWQYIFEENIELPSIYFAHEREVFERDGMLMAYSEFLKPENGENVFTETVRFRTVGDMTITGGIKSDAVTLEQVIAEIAVARVSERGASRADDRTAEAAMEDRKREGYF
jgi:sulfate adenylyltransferase subunit 2